MQDEYGQRQESGGGRGFGRERQRERGWSSRREPYEGRGYGGRGYEDRFSGEGGYGGRGYEPDEREFGGRWEGRMGQRDVEQRSPRGEYGAEEYGGRGYGYEGGGYAGGGYEGGGYQRGYGQQSGYAHEPESRGYAQGRRGFEGRGYSNIFDEERRGGQRQTSFRGTGPRGYSRSDEAILEDVCEELRDAELDPSEVTVEVADGNVTLTGSIDSRWAKRYAEDVAYEVRGVRDVHNRLTIEGREAARGGVREEYTFGEGGNGQRRRGAMTEAQTQQQTGI